MSQTNKAEKIWNLLSAIAVKVSSRRNRTNKNIWVFGEWFGRKCNDNCIDVYKRQWLPVPVRSMERH